MTDGKAGRQGLAGAGGEAQRRPLTGSPRARSVPGATQQREDRGLAIGSLKLGSPPATALAGAPAAGDPELEWLLARRTPRALVDGVTSSRTSVPAPRPRPVAPVAPPPRPAQSPAASPVAAEAAVAGARRAVPAARPVGTAGPGVVLDVTRVGPSVRIFRVGRPAGFEFEAGQSMKLGLDRSSVRRRYSIASAPHEPHLEFCIEGVPGGHLTSLLFEIVPGEPLALAPAAKGSFTLRADRRRHVMVATVTGIAPLRSMLREALFGATAARTRAEAPEFWLLHGASYADELPYADELAALARSDARVHYLPTVSRPGASRNVGWTGSQGRVDTHVLRTVQALGSKGDIAVYACGHPEMVRNVRESLEPLGYLVLDEAYD